MNRDDKILLTAVLLFSLLMFGVGATASSQDYSAITDASALHRLCASESSWRTTTADCDGVHAVLLFRMDHIRPYRDDTLAQAAARYSRGRITRTTGGRPWIGALQPSCEEPVGWSEGRWLERFLTARPNRDPDRPVQRPWAGTQQERGCRRLYQRVLDIMHGERDDVVLSPVHDWGAPSISDAYQADNPDARPARFADPTDNDFWELGRYTLRFGDSS